MPISSEFINRDLSWLTFNERVLAQAEDDGVPLLERSFLTCREVGDFVRGGIAAAVVCWQCLERGDRLADVYYPAIPEPDAETEIFDSLSVFPEELQSFIPAELTGLFDTQQAASFLGWNRTGYASVVEAVCGIKLAKSADEVTLGEIVAALEGAPTMTSCESLAPAKNGECEVEATCPIRS